MPQTSSSTSATCESTSRVRAIARANTWNRESTVTGDAQPHDSSRWPSIEFLDMFELPLVAGDRSRALRDPTGVLSPESAATRLFGEADPLGQPRHARRQLDRATVVGIVGEIPEPRTSATLVSVAEFRSHRAPTNSTNACARRSARRPIRRPRSHRPPQPRRRPATLRTPAARPLSRRSPRRRPPLLQRRRHSPRTGSAAIAARRT
jgi:hypothetical protein